MQHRKRKEPDSSLKVATGARRGVPTPAAPQIPPQHLNAVSELEAEGERGRGGHLPLLPGEGPEQALHVQLAALPREPAGTAGAVPQPGSASRCVPSRHPLATQLGIPVL
jgi:hypothetical protein